VFLSYRRADDLFLAGRLRDRLAAVFGDENVFFDVDSIEPGTDFREVIRERIDAADVVLALIGARWNAGRLAVVNDYVRIEIGESLRQHKPLIPVLIADTAMPGPDELPEELASLAFFNALRIRPDPDFHRDSGQLVEAITDANERELARVVEEKEPRIPAVTDASRQNQDIGSGSPPDNVSSASPRAPPLAAVASSEAADRLERAGASSALLEQSAEDGNGGAGLKRDAARRRRRRWIAAGVAITVAAVAVTTIVVFTRGSEDATGQLGQWAAEVDDHGDVGLRLEGGDLIAGTEPAWDVKEQRLAYKPTGGGDGCGLCGVESGSDRPVELVRATTKGVLHAPAWSDSGSLLYARTERCTPGGDCVDEIFLTRPGAPSSTQRVPSSNLKGVVDLEVDPQSQTDDPKLVQVAMVNAGGAKLMQNGKVKELPHGGDVTDLTYSANSHVIAGLPEGRLEPGLELWTRTGESIATVDLGKLLTDGKNDGFDTGLDITTVEAISVSPTGNSADSLFVVALSDDSGQVGAVEINVPYNSATAQLEETPRVSGLASIPYALHRRATLKELVRLREPD